MSTTRRQFIAETSTLAASALLTTPLLAQDGSAATTFKSKWQDDLDRPWLACASG